MRRVSRPAMSEALRWGEQALCRGPPGMIECGRDAGSLDLGGLQRPSPSSRDFPWIDQPHTAPPDSSRFRGRARWPPRRPGAVVRLDRILDQTEPPPLAGARKARLQIPHQSHRPKRRNVATHAEGHVAGMTSREGGSSSVRVASSRPRLAPGTRSPSTPARDCTQIEAQLPVARLHESHRDMPLCHMRSDATAPRGLNLALF